MVQLPYEAAGEVSKAPESDLARAWQGVSLVRNTPVTVVLALERIGTIAAGTPAVVTESARESEAIRTLAEQAHQLETSPASISGAVSNLAAVNNPSLAAYLHVYLTKHETVNNPDLAVRLLGQMIGMSSIPAAAYPDIADDIVLDYHRLTPASHAAVIGRFTELARTTNAQVAGPAFRGLGKIAAFDDSAGSFVAPGAREELGAAYNALVKDGTISRNNTLEQQLGIKHE